MDQMTNNGKQTFTFRSLVKVQVMYSKKILLMLWVWYVKHMYQWTPTLLQV